MDVRLAWTDCVEAGHYVVPNVLSPRDLVSRPDNMDEAVLHNVLMDWQYCFREGQSVTWQFLEQYLTILQPVQRRNSSPSFIQLSQTLDESTSESGSED